MSWYKGAQETELFRKSPVPPDPLFTGKGGKVEGDRREKILCDAIRKLAEEWNVGPIKEPLHIDSCGNIQMLQKSSNGFEYDNPQPIDDNLIKIAVKYNLGYGPGISTRWIELNHFTWEKLLGDMGLLPKTVITKEEFLKDISK